ncbi:hypothetical protein SO694_00036231 [Aureococcus anophagefferens]|uniref:Uncharacterized protein n=1 Tax=Aureococcus anophagefferens TaxID=44056 RepID=A0ABR1FLA8_AURAN
MARFAPPQSSDFKVSRTHAEEMIELGRQAESRSSMDEALRFYQLAHKHQLSWLESVARGDGREVMADEASQPLGSSLSEIAKIRRRLERELEGKGGPRQSLAEAARDGRGSVAAVARARARRRAEHDVGPGSLRAQLEQKEVQIAMLTKQLEAAGPERHHRGRALAEAKNRLQAALAVIVGGDGASKRRASERQLTQAEAEAEMEKWDTFITHHPEHASRPSARPRSGALGPFDADAPVVAVVTTYDVAEEEDDDARSLAEMMEAATMGAEDDDGRFRGERRRAAEGAARAPPLDAPRGKRGSIVSLAKAQLRRTSSFADGPAARSFVLPKKESDGARPRCALGGVANAAARGRARARAGGALWYALVRAALAPHFPADGAGDGVRVDFVRADDGGACGSLVDVAAATFLVDVAFGGRLDVALAALAATRRSTYWSSSAYRPTSASMIAFGDAGRGADARALLGPGL